MQMLLDMAENIYLRKGFLILDVPMGDQMWPESVWCKSNECATNATEKTMRIWACVRNYVKIKNVKRIFASKLVWWSFDLIIKVRSEKFKFNEITQVRF